LCFVRGEETLTNITTIHITIEEGNAGGLTDYRELIAVKRGTAAKLHHYCDPWKKKVQGEEAETKAVEI